MRRENRIVKSVFFIISPILALPGILYGIYNKSNFNLGLLALLFGILSYLYIPHISNDRARYFEMYNTFELFNFNDFLLYLGNGRPDFIFHLLIYLTNKIGISLQFLLLLITSFTTGVWFYIFSKIADSSKLTNQSFFLGFLLVLCSFSLPDLFSGIRFYFASSFLMLGFYQGFFEKKSYIGVFLLIIGTFIHFSASLFIPLYFLILLFPEKYKWYRILFLISFVFMLLPKTFLISIMDTVSLSEGYEKKAELYLEGEDFIEGGITGESANYLIVYLFSILWSYFAYIYMIFTIKRKSLLRNLMYLFFGVVNIFYTITTVYARYLIILKFVFVLMLIYEMVNYKIKKPLLITLSLFVLSIISNLIVMRFNIEQSFFNKHILSLIMVFYKNISSNDFLY